MTFSFPSPPWSTLGKHLESLLRKALYDYKMLDGVPKLAIALSGGKDSLTLLFLLKAVMGRGFPPIELCAIHVGGEFSCGAGIDTFSLQQLCEMQNIQFIECTSTQKLDKLECYSCSRERRKLLFDAAKNAGATTIAFGHHRDDHAQTVLMNLLHKAEFAGNLPKLYMQNFDITIVRPLIYITEADIKCFAQQQGFARIVCRCPVGQKSMRKQVDQLLNDIELIFPNARANIAKAGLVYGSTKAANP